jgi:hypothetical protein
MLEFRIPDGLVDELEIPHLLWQRQNQYKITCALVGLYNFSFAVPASQAKLW